MELLVVIGFQYVSGVAHSDTGEANIVVPSIIEKDGIEYRVTEVFSTAFSGSKILENISLEEGLKQIRYGAFFSCKNLKTVTLPSSIESIENAFWNCPNLEKVKINKPANEIRLMKHYPWDISGKIYDVNDMLVE